MERLVTVEFGPSRSKRFGKAVALAQGGPGECSESEPGRYRVTFLLGADAALYGALGRLLERVRHWRATEVYEGDELVSSYRPRISEWIAYFATPPDASGYEISLAGAARPFDGCIADLPWSACYESRRVHRRRSTGLIWRVSSTGTR